MAADLGALASVSVRHVCFRSRFKDTGFSLAHIITSLCSVISSYTHHHYRHPKWLDFHCTTHGKKQYMPELIAELDRQLTVNPWFKRSGGYDHLLMASHWHVSAYVNLFRKTKVLGHCSQINFEDKQMPHMPMNAISLPNLYVGKMCEQNGIFGASLRPQPPKVMGFQFIGDIRERAKLYKQSLIHANGKEAHSVPKYFGARPKPVLLTARHLSTLLFTEPCIICIFSIFVSP